MLHRRSGSSVERYCAARKKNVDRTGLLSARVWNAFPRDWGEEKPTARGSKNENCYFRPKCLAVAHASCRRGLGVFFRKRAVGGSNPWGENCVFKSKNRLALGPCSGRFSSGNGSGIP